jgi:phasin
VQARRPVERITNFDLSSTSTPDVKVIPMPQSQDPFSTVVPFEMPGSIREFAEKGVSQARETYEKFKDVAQSSNETIEAVYASASKGASEYSGKLIDIARANANSAFDVAEKLVAVKSPSEVFSIWTTYARGQYETLTAQAKELAELSQRVATETVEPIKTASSKVFSKVA